MTAIRGRRLGDTPQWIAAAAVNRLPADRGDWSRAMLAELAHVDGRARRWRFAAGIVRVALFPPPRHRHRTVFVALAGLAVAAAATLAAAREVPSLALFAAVLGVLLCGYATVATARSWRLPRSAPRLIVGTVALTGLAATIACVVWIAVAHPQATTDRTQVFPVLFAIVLTTYLALTLARPRLGTHPNTALWWALAATLSCGVVWIVSALTTSVDNGAVGHPWLAGAAASLTVSIGVSAATSDRSAGTRAALLTALLSAPIHVALDLTTLLRTNNFTLTNPYDQAAYPRSGYTDVASYILSDAIGGEIIAGLILYPITLLTLAFLGATLGTAVSRGREVTSLPARLR